MKNESAPDSIESRDARSNSPPRSLLTTSLRSDLLFGYGSDVPLWKCADAARFDHRDPYVGYCDGWTLNALLTTSSSYRKCSKRRTLDHSAQAISLLQIEGTTKYSHIARGFSFGSVMACVAEPNLRYSGWANRRADPPANGCEEWRRRKLRIFRRNSRRRNKTYFCTSKTDSSLKLIRSAAIQFCGG
jgi:hypothetical protein